MENTLWMQKKRVLYISFLTYGCLIAGAHAAESLQQEGGKKRMALMMSHTLLLKDITAHFLLLQFSPRPPIQTRFVTRNERILELRQVFKAGWLLGYVFWLLHFPDSAGKICSVWVWYPDTWTKTLFYRGLVFYFLCSRLTVPSLPLLARDVVRCWGSVTPCRENTNLRSWWRSLLTWPRGTNRTLLTSSLRWDLCLAWRKGHMTRVSYFGTVI